MTYRESNGGRQTDLSQVGECISSSVLSCQRGL
jgi:hypothetical protein